MAIVKGRGMGKGQGQGRGQGQVHGAWGTGQLGQGRQE